MVQLSAFGRLDKPASAVLFAGLGGACEGIKRATGVAPLVAINHNPHAIWLHKLNHPETLHLPEDVRAVVPRETTRGRKLDFIWMSPDCTDFSRAKGGKPRSSDTRSLANVAIPWLEQTRPRILFLENVPEFEGWGPLDDDGNRIAERKGEYFREWVGNIEALGYQVDWRCLVAADYGAPTTRKRLYLVARRDGQPIVWPEPTHGPGRALPWRTAGECIDWSIPALSIFATREEAKAWAKLHGCGIPQRPLAEATLRRVARGLIRFVVESPKPYLVRYHGEKRPDENPRIRSLDLPLPTATTENRFGLVVPHITKAYGTGTGSPLDVPCPTVTTGAGRGNSHLGLVSAYIANTRNGEREGQAPRVHDLAEPYPTVTAKGSQGALVAAWLAKHYTGATGTPLDAPMDTVTGIDHHTLCEAALSHEEHAGARRVAAFLSSYYGQGVGQALHDPMRTVTTLDRFGLVTVVVDGMPRVIYDVTLRMLRPRELARAMGFPDSYRLEGSIGDQVARIGGAVCPPVAESLVKVNLQGRLF